MKVSLLNWKYPGSRTASDIFTQGKKKNPYYKILSFFPFFWKQIVEKFPLIEGYEFSECNCSKFKWWKMCWWKSNFIPKSWILVLLHSESHYETQDKSQRSCIAQLFQLWNAEYISWDEKSCSSTFFTGIYYIIVISIHFSISFYGNILSHHE